MKNEFPREEDFYNLKQACDGIFIDSWDSNNPMTDSEIAVEAVKEIGATYAFVTLGATQYVTQQSRLAMYGPNAPRNIVDVLDQQG